MEKYLDITKPRYRLISYLAGAWQYRLFPDFLNSRFKMACKIEGIVKVLHTVETISRARLLQKVNSGTPRVRFARARGRRPIVYLPIRENLVIGGRTPAHLSIRTTGIPMTLTFSSLFGSPGES